PIFFYHKSVNTSLYLGCGGVVTPPAGNEETSNRNRETATTTKSLVTRKQAIKIEKSPLKTRKL
ncbi:MULTISPECIES: hypothetical protein, partial [unclassified Microcoleus]|uniref:hypothetical protein n=1 Tax=unclassified Microcoleus TaxID=2642155 RepID=UPI002FD6C42F